MKAIRRLIALMLAMMFCVLPAMAEEAEPAVHVKNAYSYIVLEDGTAELVGYSGTYDSSTVPMELDGYVLSSIRGNPFAGNEALQHFEVDPDHPYFAVIDGVLFSKADKRLVAFPQASSMVDYAVPQGICIIGEEAFRDCKKLQTITLPDTVTEIRSGAFRDCDRLGSLNIPGAVAVISADTFYGCRDLSKVYLPSCVTSIEDRAFYNCPALRMVTIPSGLTFIGSSAFGLCPSIHKFTIPDSVISIGANPFYICEGLTELEVSPEHPCLEVIDGVLFLNEGEEKTLVFYPGSSTAETYTVPQGVTAIGDDAFSSCELLKKVHLPDGLTSIGESAFSGCQALESLDIPDSVQRIGRYAFSRCKRLQKMVIPEGVTVIEEGLFNSCNALKSITLPASITEIDKKAFSSCSFDLVLTVSRDSFAHTYAETYYISYNYPDTNDWLNN